MSKNTEVDAMGERALIEADLVRAKKEHKVV